ncbi:hypothetical protein [Paenibacillus sp. NEAU-GSW1]|uniref:hypothetical protein n=1 Tax=Paenibacillus sp. NEAU-GSW1 TaxID=2682486 RepID=UPI001565AC9E|nr:hypothetical protein [Paenibacillus sp. NEAU-GSW1]
MSKENIISVIAIVAAIIIVVFYINHLNQTKEAGSGSASTVNVHFDLSEHFESVESLQESASLIARVKIKDTSSYQYGNVVFTLSDATVKKVYKGDIEKQADIRILETGGSYEGLVYIAEGNAVFAKNDEAVVFLEKYDGPVAEDAYVIKGVYQGKFKVKGDQLIPSDEVFGELQTVDSYSDLNLINE